MVGRAGVFCHLARRPVARLTGAFQLLINVDLPGSGDYVGHALGDDGGSLVIVRLTDEARSWIEVAPHVGGGLTAQPALSGNKRLRIKRLRQARSPHKRIEGAEEVGVKCPGSGVAGVAGDAAANQEVAGCPMASAYLNLMFD